MGRKKPGPKAERRNPYPLADEVVDTEIQDGRVEWVRLLRSEDTAWITAGQLDPAERALRRSFKANRRELSRRPGETLETATRRIAELARDVAEENADVLWWTGRRREYAKEVPVERLYPLTRDPDGSWTCRYVGPGLKRGTERRYRIASRPPERYDEATRSWKPTDTPARMIEAYDADSQSWKRVIGVPEGANAEKWLGHMARPAPFVLKSTWPKLVAELRDRIARMLRGEMGCRFKKEGKAAYLAYATLGVLLDLSSQKVHELLNNYRYPRQRRKS